MKGAALSLPTAKEVCTEKTFLYICTDFFSLFILLPFFVT